MLRSILSCFPFEMCKLWKLKAVTLMLLLVNFFLFYLFFPVLFICYHVLGELDKFEKCFFPLFPISRKYAHI